MCVCVPGARTQTSGAVSSVAVPTARDTRCAQSMQYGWVGHACMNHRTSKHAHKLAEFLLCAWASHSDKSYGPMDKAPAYGAGDSGFESL